MSGDMALRVRVPTASHSWSATGTPTGLRSPLELHLALKNMRVLQNAHYRVLGSEVCQALPRDAFGVPAPRFFCAICSRRLLARSSPRWTNVSKRGPLSRVVSQDQVKNVKAVFKNIPCHCDMTRKRLHDEGVERECLLQPIDSDRTEKFHRRRAERAGLCYTRPVSEDGIFQSEVRRKGVAGGCERVTQCAPQPPTCLFIPFFLSFLKVPSTE